MITRALIRETPDKVSYDPSPVGYAEEALGIGNPKGRGANDAPMPAPLPRLPLEGRVTRGYGDPIFRALTARANTR